MTNKAVYRALSAANPGLLPLAFDGDGDGGGGGGGDNNGNGNGNGRKWALLAFAIVAGILVGLLV